MIALPLPTQRRVLSRPPAGRERGFSLLEGLLAALLLAATAGGLLRAMSALASAGRDSARLGLAARVARAQMDRLHAAPLTRGWFLPGPHPTMEPGGSVDPGGTPVPGYFRYFDEEGAAADRSSAVYEVRWRIREGVSPGEDRLASLKFEVIALPFPAGRGPVVRLESLRVANGESP